MNPCKNCINFRDTGSSFEGYCACWDAFVGKSETCDDYQDDEDE